MALNQADMLRKLRSAGPLFDSLRSEDDLDVVVRCHLYIESVLEEVLEETIPRYEYIKRGHFGFDKKVALALSMGLTPPVSTASASSE